jgi:hypothetical protein
MPATMAVMARRPTPERIHEAQRAGVRARLISSRMMPETADAWLAEWDALAARDGLAIGSGYWTAAWDWIDAQRQTRRPRA